VCKEIKEICRGHTEINEINSTVIYFEEKSITIDHIHVVTYHKAVEPLGKLDTHYYYIS